MAKRARRKPTVSRKKSTKRSYSRSSKRHSEWRHSFFRVFKLIIAICLVAFVIYLIANQFLFKSSKPFVPGEADKTEITRDSMSDIEYLDYRLYKLFQESNLLEGWIERSGNTIKVRLPIDFSSITLVHSIITLTSDLGVKLIDSREDLAQRKYTIDIGQKDKSVRTLILTQESSLKRHRGKIAIIIDDFGYADNDEIDRLLSLDQMINCAVIPGLPRSKKMYEKILSHKKEALVHMPMEAKEEKVEYSDYTIYASYPDAEIARRIGNAFAEYPAAHGMNNHMGSLATSNAQAMQAVMNEVKRQGKFFVDSKTAPESVAFETAQKLHVPSAERDVFLERSRDESKDYLKKMLLVAAKIAEQTGKAVIIGHPYNNTIDVLLDEIPKMVQDGYDFVAVSEIVK
ncbi:divergent polysaccharide deacetylase family protein [candidate division KSB1 bacterium]|nr:divergent polysaccharide deacetylase family protein [candidate division KSB1 bacterium]